MKLALGTFYIDTIPAKVELDRNNVLCVVLGGDKFYDADVLLDMFPLLDTPVHAEAKVKVLTPLYLGLNFQVLVLEDLPAMRLIRPHFTEHALIWTLQEDRTRLFYKANLILKSRTLAVTLI